MSGEVARAVDRVHRSSVVLSLYFRRLLTPAKPGLAGVGRAQRGRDEEELDRRRRDRTETAQGLVAEHAPDGVDVTIVVEFGSPARVISDYATKTGAGLVIMSTRARGGAGRFIFGSVTEQVIQDSSTPS